MIEPQDAQAFRGRAVLVTGHTGFKGAWLTALLLELGAKVSGLSLPPPTAPSVFEVLGLAQRIDHAIGDIRDRALVAKRLVAKQPDVVFHLAAQALVRESYQTPADTFEANVQGTANVLEAVRRSGRSCAVVVVTSDKCYENNETGAAFRESDPLGGNDPYSASKAAAEIVVASYRKSFFAPERFADHRVALASARAGNVIGGGDWAADRIVPDLVRALAAGQPPVIRNPGAIRPWQHVLDALSGYLRLAARLQAPGGEQFAGAWNFGPVDDRELPVGELAALFHKAWGAPAQAAPPPAGQRQPHEAHYLRLDCAKARRELQWRPTWDVLTAVARTADWYRRHAAGEAMAARTAAQIQEFAKAQPAAPSGAGKS